MSQNEIISCKHCGAAIPPTAEKCSVCGMVLSQELGPTIQDKNVRSETPEKIDIDVPPPHPDEIPTYIKKIDKFVVMAILIVVVIFNYKNIRFDEKKSQLTG